MLIPSINKSCWCGKVEDTQHSTSIFLNTGQMIYKENIPKFVKVYKQFEINYKRRKEYENKIKNKEINLHEILQSDPLFSIVGPSGVRALPLAAGINVVGHYKWHYFSLSFSLSLQLIANSPRRGCRRNSNFCMGS